MKTNKKISSARFILIFIILLLVSLGCGAPVPPFLLATPQQPTPAPGQSLTVHFIDVGQGDAILIRDAAGNAVLIDGGNQDSLALNYLQGLGVKKIDLMLATHPHSDHIGGLIQVLKSIPVTKVITNGQMHTTPTYEQFLDAISGAKAAYGEVKRGDVIAWGENSFQVLHPATNTGDNLNGNSLVVLFTYGKTTVLLMGDADSEAEKSILASGSSVKADIFKVGHHGSKYSSIPAFLERVSPAVAVYSAGAGNTYGHPAPQTMTNLQKAGAQVLGTDKNGTIVITIGETGYSVLKAKGN
jgi:competence protein ComEC